ncbi:MAG TPA: oxidoreductase [Vicinamibacterales bacterium]|nr:oxidoreductase [Vicinamibacterales bacterium]
MTSPPREPSAPLRVALIGYGYAGRTFHAPLIRSTPGLRLVSVCSRDATRVHRDLPGIAVTASLDDAIAGADADLIVIATPSHTHARLAMASLRAGKHVVVEKPLALTHASASDVARTAREKGRIVSVFHNRRWDGDFITLRQILERDTLGRVAHFESHFDRYRPEVKDRWRERAGPGAGVWYDLGPHLVDQALLLFGRPDRVLGDLATLRDAAVVDDWAHVVLDYPARRVVLHASMLVAGDPVRFVVHGRRGTWVMQGADVQEQQLQRGLTPLDPSWGENPRRGRLIDGATGVTVETPTAQGAYERFYMGVRDAILDRGPNPVSIDDALAVITIVETAIESSKQRRALTPDMSDPR